MARKECSHPFCWKYLIISGQKNPFMMPEKQQKMKDSGWSMDSQYSYKNLYLFHGYLIKVQIFFKKGDCTGIYILEYKEY